METGKLIILLSMFGVLFCSCRQQEETYDMNLAEVQQECNLLRQDKALALEDNVEAQQILDNIFASLNSISGRISTLELSLGDNPENSNRTKAEEIAKDIIVIKEKLGRAENMESVDKSTKIIISKLKESLEQKEREVKDIKKIIKKKDEQITILDQQVSSLCEELEQRNRQLRENIIQLNKTKEELRSTEIGSWICMGDELISAAKEMDKTEKGDYKEIKGNFNYKRMKKAQLTIIRKGITCYQKAQNLGSTIASSKLSEASQLLYHKEQL